MISERTAQRLQHTARRFEQADRALRTGEGDVRELAVNYVTARADHAEAIAHAGDEYFHAQLEQRGERARQGREKPIRSQTTGSRFA